MSRPILPLPSADGRDAGQHLSPLLPQSNPGEGKRHYAKRGAISKIACRSCRRRKTKCNSERPSCQNCAARSEHCIYDFDESDRSLTFLRDNVENLAEERNALQSLLYTLQNDSENASMEIFRRLRNGDNVTSLAQQVAASRALTDVGKESQASTPSSNLSRLDQYEQLLRAITTSTSGEQDEIIRRMRSNFDPTPVLAAIRTRTLLHDLRSIGTPNDIEREYSSPEQAFRLVRVNKSNFSEVMDVEHAQASSPLESWTNVTQDAGFVEHLFRIYFSWQHTFFQNLPEDLFRADYVGGGTRYCSSFLVNAICAAGCLLSGKGEARQLLGNPLLTSQRFCDAALSSLQEKPSSSICTVAGLGILANFEASRGQLSSMWNYCGQSGRMALDMGLHLHDVLAADQPNQIDHFDEHGKMHTFWGCFITDQVTSFTLGRLPQIPINGVTTGIPPVDDEVDAKPWVAYYDSSLPIIPGACSSTFREVVSLCIIVNSTLTMFFSPAKDISGSLLLGEHKKYVRWKNNLPAIIATTDRAPPHVLCAHLLWHSAVLLLFRPFLRAKIADSHIIPKEICRQSADAISELFGRHRELYDFQGIYSFQIQCLLAACTIHIIHIPAIASTDLFIDACNSLHELAGQNSWASSSIAVLKDLVSRWGRILPGAAEAALYQDTADPSSHGLHTAEYTHKRPAEMSLHQASGKAKRPRLSEVNQPQLFAPSASQPAPLVRPTHSGFMIADEDMDDVLKPGTEFEGLNFMTDDWWDPFVGSAVDGWNPAELN